MVNPILIPSRCPQPHCVGLSGQQGFTSSGAATKTEMYPALPDCVSLDVAAGYASNQENRDPKQVHKIGKRGNSWLL